MKFADSQIDVLLRRYGRQVKNNASGEHLDADELNAFAEGATPDAARSRYVAHLADCDDCRKLATQLTISAGAVARLAGGSLPARESVWQRVTSFFAPPMLRYAAFAAVVIAAVGVTFIALRRETRFNAVSEPVSERQAAVSKSAESPGDSNHVAQTYATPSLSTVQPDKNANANRKQDQPQTLDGIAPPKPGKDEVAEKSSGDEDKKKTAEPMIAKEQQPSYAPPPGEAGRAEKRGREESDLGGIGPRKTETTANQSKIINRSQTGELNRDQRIGGPNRSAANQQMANQNTEARNEPTQTPNTAKAAPKEAESVSAKKPSVGFLRSDDSQKAPDSRSVRGHKFHRQGKAWIDVKYKSGMAIINVERGSDAFRALNSDVRSIAEQIAGEVIIVKSGKAYRIQ